MSNEIPENIDELLRGSKRDFDAAVDATDTVTAARLGAARRNALAATERASAWKAARIWVPAAVAVGIAAVVVVPRLDPSAPGVGDELDALAVTDLEILLGDEALEMLAELEFFEWLELQDGTLADYEADDGVG